mmetsp:Transcript_29180/g.44119  ORF Transcript_29180/g.44119 Transcript_29180/m.44119 type:complete len:427 (-) Transcript_29180:152-1432(-)
MSEKDLRQQMTLSILPRITGIMSIICSLLIIFTILRKKIKTLNVYNRLILALSICDVNTTIWYSLSTAPIPSGSPNVYGAQGTQALCTAQGFFIQTGIATPMLNAMLSIYYLLIVRYKWKEHEIKKLQKYFFGIPFIWALATASVSVGLSLFQGANFWCWIAPLPSQYRWIFYYGPLWITIFIATTAMVLLYSSVKQTELKAKKWSMSTRLENSKKLSNAQKVRNQAFFYLLAFYFVYIPPTITRLIQAATGQRIPFPLQVILVIAVPSQGVLNFWAYIRPKYLRYRQKNPGSICATLLKICLPCCKLQTSGDDSGSSSEDSLSEKSMINSPVTESKGEAALEIARNDGKNKSSGDNVRSSSAIREPMPAQETKLTLPNGDNHNNSSGSHLKELHENPSSSIDSGEFNDDEVGENQAREDPTLAAA